jgi:mannose-6-phosphate isomerase
VDLYPLKFVPRYVEKIWGGRKLETVLGKALPPDKPIGESWEIYDFPPGVVDGSTGRASSVIANGTLAGRTLHWVMENHVAELLGSPSISPPNQQFPLLIKYLDAREDLSVQVHPNQSYADAHPGAHLKSEAWYVLESEPGARLLKGVKPGTTREQFHAALAAGHVERHVASVPARAGDCHYLPSGTVHALGAGMLVAEVQMPSDTTFRVYDFDRVEPSTGKPRTLHVEQAMECIDFDSVVERERPRPSDGMIVNSPFFQIRRHTASKATKHFSPEGKSIVLMLLAGSLQIEAQRGADPVTFTRGETALLPASLKKPTLTAITDCQWLEVHLPA